MKIIAEQARRWLGLVWEESELYVQALDAEVAVTREPVVYAKRKELSYRPIEEGEVWSDHVFDCAWFHLSGVCTETETDGLCVKFDVDGEGLVYDAEGCPARGLSNKAFMYDSLLGKPGKVYLPFTDGAFDPAKIDLWIDAANNDLFGNAVTGKLIDCRIVRRRKAALKLYYDLVYLTDLAIRLEEGLPQKCAILYAVERAGLKLHAGFTDEEAIAADAELGEVSAAGTPDPYLTFYAVGHSHLDLAWLWPVRETRRKAARTFSTALCNLRDDPDYVYGASQPQQFAWVKEDYPVLYERIRAAVREGRFEPQGAMWTEADVNISGAEALVRQFLYGLRFWREEFGVEIDTLWLPDAFGFCGALPAIMRGCGVKNFLTIKLSWNAVNRFPYHSFRWRGIDGSEVLVHMPPEGNYNSPASASAVLDARDRYAERGLSRSAMLLYGIGDGGGGPGEGHLETVKRGRSVQGLPRVRTSSSKTFFEALRQEAERLPVCRGELYLEKHQGTYTSQAKNKRYNRFAENALLEAEAIACAADAKLPEEFEALWKETLLYQFHDILPGSSIRRVYDETEERYPAILGRVREITDVAASKLGKRRCAFNNTGFVRHEHVRDGEAWYSVDAAPFAFGALCPAVPVTPKVENFTVENENLRAQFDSSGALISLYDKRLGRETLAEPSNLFRVYNDCGNAWDPYPYYANAEGGILRAESCREVFDGARAGLEFAYAFGASRMRIFAYLKCEGIRLDFEAECDWQENEKMLRVDFSPAVETTEATFEIQFGAIKRKTTENNAIESAQYEVCGHKWVDLSERDFGLSLLNDSKYGFRAKHGKLSMDLLRAQNHPCKDQDRGAQKFAYALLPHAADETNVEIRREAYFLNRPLFPRGAAPTESLACFDDDRIVIEGVKPAEDGDGYIVRAFNATDGTAFARIFAQGRIVETDLLERGETPIDGKQTFRPYEIKSYRVRI